MTKLLWVIQFKNLVEIQRIVRIHGKNKGIALTVDSSAHYCLANPIIGGKQVVCEAWRNLISVGSKPIAITNCLNFGNPEKIK